MSVEVEAEHQGIIRVVSIRFTAIAPFAQDLAEIQYHG